MKLELKHIAPYLPYNVYVGDGRTPFKLTEHNFTNVFKYLTTIYLHPLSDLKKEIRHKDVDFIPVEFLIKEGFNVSDKWIESGFIDIIRSDYEFIQLLLEWHFDIYGLIENGLAVDINTLNNDL